MRDLDHQRFSVREDAGRRLTRSGRAAIDPLAKAAANGSLEVVIRSITILHRLAVNEDSPTAADARQALEQLAAPQLTAASRQAAAALVSLRVQQAEIAVRRYRQFGGGYGTGNLQGGQPTESHALIGKTWSGGEDGLEVLQWLKGVSIVSLHNVPATDKALAHLKALTNIRRLELYGTRITPEAVLDLQAALPTVDVDFRRGGLLGVSGSITDVICRFTTVRAGSAAQRAGIQLGDVVVKCDGKPVPDFTTLTSIISTKHGGDKLKLEIVRNGQPMQFEVTLGYWGE